MRTTATFLLIGLSCFSLAACQLFGTTGNVASTDFQTTLTAPNLADFGDSEGTLIVAVYDNSSLPPRLRVPRAKSLALVGQDAVARVTLGSFVERTGLRQTRVNPLVEVGAIYYFPKRFNENEARTGRVVQKACGTVDGHQVDEAIINDEPSGIRRDRRKMILDGSIDASLIKAFTGVTAKVDASYLIEVELIGTRLRSLNSDDARIVRQRILAGDRCRSEYLESIGDSTAYQLTSAYYGQIKVKQAYEIAGEAGVPKLQSELSFKSDEERESFLFFMIFLDEV